MLERAQNLTKVYNFSVWRYSQRRAPLCKQCMHDADPGGNSYIQGQQPQTKKLKQRVNWMLGAGRRAKGGTGVTKQKRQKIPAITSLLTLHMYSNKPVNGASVRAPPPPCQVKSGQYWPSLLSIVRDQMRGRTNLSQCLHHTWTSQPYSGTHCSSSWGSLGATDDAEIPQPYPPRNPGLWNANGKVFSAGVGRHMAFLAAPAAETSAFLVISASEVPSTSFSPQPSSNAGWHLTFVENQLLAGDLLSVPFSPLWCDLCGRQVLN